MGLTKCNKPMFSLAFLELYAYSELYFKLRSHCKFSKIKMIASKARSYATQRYKYTWGQGDLAKLPTSLQAAY